MRKHVVSKFSFTDDRSLFFKPKCTTIVLIFTNNRSLLKFPCSVHGIKDNTKCMECLWWYRNVSLRFQSWLFYHPKFESSLSVVALPFTLCPLPRLLDQCTQNPSPLMLDWTYYCWVLGQSKEGNLTLVESALAFFLFCFVFCFFVFVCLFLLVCDDQIQTTAAKHSKQGAHGKDWWTANSTLSTTHTRQRSILLLLITMIGAL